MPGTSSSTAVSATINWRELDAIVPSTASVNRQARTVAPDSAGQVSAVLQWADRNGAVVAAIGGGSKQRWGNAGTPPDLLLSTGRISKMIEHAWEDMTFTVEAGMTVAHVQAELAKHGQRLALDPLWAHSATIGGVVATNDSGPLRLRYGSIRDLVLGVTVVLANGTVARSGGKVVKNVAGYDLPKLLAGSMGTLAIITEATFRAHPLPRASRTLSFQFANASAANVFILLVNDSQLVAGSMQLRSGSADDFRVDILFEGVPAGVDAHTLKTIELAAGASHDEIPGDIWRAGESLFTARDHALVARISILPTRIADAITAARQHFSSVQAVIQATGLGLVRLEAATADQLTTSLAALRAAIAQLGGSLVVLDAPDSIRNTIDVYGPPADSWPLMLRVKQQFDPNGILNRGRFVGGM